MGTRIAFDNVAYNKIGDDVVAVHSVFSVSDGPLPSYVRSLSPKGRLEGNNPTDIIDENDRGTHIFTNIRFLVVLATFLVTSLVTVSIIICNYWPLDMSKITLNQTRPNATKYRIVDSRVVISDVRLSVLFNKTLGTPCVHQCIAYRGSRFGSQCNGGYCRCNGHYYQHQTCLPYINDCVIKKDAGTTYLNNNQVLSYSCQPKSSENLHVISIYGNHFSKQTVVNLSGSTDQNLTIVLCSHYPVRWKLKYPNSIAVQNIVLISDRTTRSLAVKLDKQPDNHTSPVISKDQPQPVITRIRIPVGYGYDRHGMDTVSMLRIIQDKYGTINSFTGTEFADRIDLKT